MRMLNYFDLGAVDSAEKTMPKGSHSYPEHRICTRLRDEVKITLHNAGGAPLDLTRAMLLDVLQKEFAEWTLAFGVKEEEIVDNNRSFNHMRVLAYLLTGHDVATVEGVELKDYVDNTLQIPAGGDLTVTFEFLRPFIFERFAGSRITEWCPGKTQMEQIAIKVKRGGAYATANLSKNGNSTHTIFADDTDGHNRWANVPRLSRTNANGFTQEGPSGALLGLLEMSAIGVATLLRTVTLKREGDEDIYKSVDARRVARGASLLTPQGSADANTLGTVLYEPEESVDLEALATSSKWIFEQADSYLAPMDLLWVYVPAITESYRDQVVGSNVTVEGKGAGAEVLGVSGPTFRGENVSGHISAITSIALVKPTDAKFPLLVGRKFARNQPARTQIPDALAGAIKAQVGAVGGDAGVSKLVQETKSIAKAIPGGRSPARGASTPLMNVLAGVMAPSESLKAAAINLLK